MESNQKTKSMVTSGDHDGCSDETVHVSVGGYFYTTTSKILLASHHEKEKQNTYFHSLLSGRWSDTKQSSESTTTTSRTASSFVISDRDGDVFFYVLYYLRFGQLPRALGTDSPYDSLLTSAETSKLLTEADFYGLEGLVQLCRVPLDLLRGLGSTGDLDLSPFSHFHVRIHNKDRDQCNYFPHYFYEMEYTFNEKTTVFACVNYAFGNGFSFEVREAGTHVNPTVIVNKKTYVSTVRHLRVIIAGMYDSGDNRSERKQNMAPTVSEVLAKTTASMIPAEARLWWAIEISEMLKIYDSNRNWKSMPGYDSLDDDDKCILRFLWYKRSWTNIGS